ncbi:hypothetical protein AB0J21_06830 [Streptomyces sp. NPDC049954]|uniref:hypothetical protein n=1 Tax=Streptomyces sp. NPDC049954 TaxID=3155779 RepID=UPI00342462B9
MRRTVRTTVTAASLTLLLVLPLSACGGGKKAVSGKRAEVRHSVDHERTCSKKSRKSTSRKSSSTRCHTHDKDLWCVALNDVGGDRARDRVWYEVKRDVYRKAQGTPVGGKLTFTPVDDDCD